MEWRTSADRDVGPIWASGVKRKGTSWDHCGGGWGRNPTPFPTNKEKGFFMHADTFAGEKEDIRSMEIIQRIIVGLWGN